MRNLLSLRSRVGYCLVILSYASASFGLGTFQSGESKSLIALEVTETISLRPFINMVVEKTEKNDLLYCYQQLQNEIYFVDAKRIVRILPEVFDYLVSKQDILEEISCGVTRNEDNHVCAVVSAVQWLYSLKTALNEMKCDELADAETIVSLSYLLDAYFDDMSLRALEDEGARQIFVGVRTTLDSVDSKIDVIDDDVAVVDSKIDVLEGHSITTESKVFVMNSEILVIDSKVDVIDDDVAVVDSKIDVLEGHSITTESKVFVMNSEILVVDSKVDVIDNETEIIDSKIGEFDAVSTDTGYFNTVESIDSAELSVLEWLKSIMRELKGL